MPSNFDRVFGQVRDFFTGWDEDKATAVKEIAIQALADAITLSPVDTGLYRASHDLTINERSTLPSNPPKGKAAAGDRLSEGVMRVSSIQRVQGQPLVIYLSNNLYYAQYIENGGSMQAPAGVYGIVRAKAIQRLESIGAFKR